MDGLGLIPASQVTMCQGLGHDTCAGRRIVPVLLNKSYRPHGTFALLGAPKAQGSFCTSFRAAIHHFALHVMNNSSAVRVSQQTNQKRLLYL